jgi:hypothetical protein
MLRDSGIVRVMAGSSARGFGFGVRGSGYKPEQLFGIGPGPAPGGLAMLTEIKLTTLRFYWKKYAQLLFYVLQPLHIYI